MRELIVISRIGTAFSLAKTGAVPSKKFYKGEGGWTDDVTKSYPFASASEAVQKISTFTLKGVYQFEIIYVVE